MKPLLGALNISRMFFESVDVALDMTCGNGYDTLALAKLAKNVYAFDIQSLATEQTKKRVADYSNVQVIQSSFVNFGDWVKEPIDLAVFNLGYLPGSDKSITTNAQDVIQCLQSLLIQLSSTGRVVIVAYPGHHEGKREVDTLIEVLQSIDNQSFRSFSLVHLNGTNKPPQLFIIERNAR